MKKVRQRKRYMGFSAKGIVKKLERTTEGRARAPDKLGVTSTFRYLIK